MNPEEAFLAAIDAHQLDDFPKRLYADWLEENGQSLHLGIRWLLEHRKSPGKEVIKEEVKEVIKEGLGSNHFATTIVWKWHYSQIELQPRDDSMCLPEELLFDLDITQESSLTEPFQKCYGSYLDAYLGAARVATELIQAGELK